MGYDFQKFFVGEDGAAHLRGGFVHFGDNQVFPLLGADNDKGRFQPPQVFARYL